MSPGLAVDALPARAARRALGVPFVSDIELFLRTRRRAGRRHYRHQRQKHRDRADRRVVAAPRISTSALAAISASPRSTCSEADRDAYVLELSSFQLERLNAGRFAVAANLNVTPGSSGPISRCRELCRQQTTHIRRLRRCDLQPRRPADTPKQRGRAAGDRSDSMRPSRDGWGIVEYGGRRYLASFGERYLDVESLGHSRQAQRIQRAGGDGARESGRRRSGARGAKHCATSKDSSIGRQTVAVVDGVTYINDSKATNLGACVAALEGLGRSAAPHRADCGRRCEERRSFAAARTRVEVRASCRNARQGCGGGRSGGCRRGPGAQGCDAA